MQGRFHRYEGYDLQQVTFPVRVMRALGAKTLIVSNACGGMNPLWAPGDLMLISDHINLLGDNPLVGPNDERWDRASPTCPRPTIRSCARWPETSRSSCGITLREGVYVAVAGPNLETRAEYRMLRAIGADVVGMSTVPEVIVASHGACGCWASPSSPISACPDALEPADIGRIIADRGTAPSPRSPGWSPRWWSGSPDGCSRPGPMARPTSWSSSPGARGRRRTLPATIEARREGRPSCSTRGRPPPTAAPASITSSPARSRISCAGSTRCRASRSPASPAGTRTGCRSRSRSRRSSGSAARRTSSVRRREVQRPCRESVFKYQAEWENSPTGSATGSTTSIPTSPAATTTSRRCGGCSSGCTSATCCTAGTGCCRTARAAARCSRATSWRRATKTSGPTRST